MGGLVSDATFSSTISRNKKHTANTSNYEHLDSASMKWADALCVGHTSQVECVTSVSVRLRNLHCIK
jgi:hypothetical protein